jgi:hypothetical protein
MHVDFNKSQEEVKMDVTDGNKNEIAAYEHGYLANLAVQDALIILTIYAAQLDPQQARQKDIDRIETLLEQCPLCVLEKKGIYSRIHKWVNAMQTLETLKVVETAAKTLTPNFREIAFELAVQVALQNSSLTSDKNDAIDGIAGALALAEQDAKRIMEKHT